MIPTPTVGAFEKFYVEWRRKLLHAADIYEYRCKPKLFIFYISCSCIQNMIYIC